MTIGQTKRVEAVHPHWTGHLLLSGADDSVTHEGVGALGRYEFLDENLIVHWNDFGDDVFIHLKGKYVHKTIIERSPNLDSLCTVMFEGRNILASQIKVFVPESFYQVCLRLLTSDLPIFNQVFLQSDYNSRHLPESARSIVDLGANIGLSTVFFALKYPQARILLSRTRSRKLLSSSYKYSRAWQPYSDRRGGCLDGRWNGKSSYRG